MPLGGGNSAGSAGVLSTVDELTECKRMMVEAERTYSRIIGEHQTIFMTMQREYNGLLHRCRDLSDTCKTQGQELYGDGRRIDELDSFIALGTQRLVDMNASAQAMKHEYEKQLQVETGKLSNARLEIEAKDKLLQQNQDRTNQMYHAACLRLEAAVVQRDVDVAAIKDGERRLVLAQAEIASVKAEISACGERTRMTRGEEMSAVIQERAELINGRRTLIAEHELAVHSAKLLLNAANTEREALMDRVQINEGNLKLATLNFEDARLETEKIRNLGMLLENKHSLLQVENQDLRKKVSNNEIGIQIIKDEAEGIVREQNTAHQVAILEKDEEASRMSERLCCLEDQVNQYSSSGQPSSSGPVASANDGFFEGLRATAGLASSSKQKKKSPSRSGGNSAGASGGGSGGGNSAGNGNGGNTGPGGGSSAAAGAKVPPKNTRHQEPPPPDPDDGDDDHNDEEEEEEEQDFEEDFPVIEVTPAPLPQPAARPPFDPGRTTVRSREQEKIVVPKFPFLVQLVQYSVSLGTALIGASAVKDYQEIGWLNEAKTKTFDELSDSGLKRYESLDVKLSIALTNSIRDAPGEAAQLYQELLEYQRIANIKGTITKGRQIYWMIMNYHKTNESQEVIIGIEHLLMLNWKGDTHMYEFKRLWENIMRRMTDPLSEPTLRGVLLKKIRDSKSLKEDIAHFDRLESTHE